MLASIVVVTLSKFKNFIKMIDYFSYSIPLDVLVGFLVGIIALGASSTVDMRRNLVEFGGVVHNGQRLVVRFKNLLGQMFT